MKQRAARQIAGVHVAVFAVAVMTLASATNAATLSCADAASMAEASTGVPSGLLLAIGDVESGRPNASGVLAPWPWTIHATGVGRFFAASEEAVSAVQALQANGVQSIDIGCFQINLFHHPDAFANLTSGFDPLTNALAAAGFLLSLRDELGGWDQAVAAYHSRTETLGASYRNLVLADWHGTRLPGGAALASMPPVETRFPGIHIWGPTGEIGFRVNTFRLAPQVIPVGKFPRMPLRLPQVLTVSVR